MLGYITARPYDLGFIEIEIKVELKDLQSMGQDLENHVKGDYILKADTKFRKLESENTSNADSIYTLTNLNRERGKNEHY